MTTDPTKSLAPQPLPPAEKNALTEMLDSDLAQLSLRELLGMLLSSVGLAERKAYLERVVHDKPNGFYDRSLEVGAIPLDLRVPRTRTGDFLRPACIYVVVGLRRDGKKQILTCLPRAGRENLEDWKAVLRNLLERGLRRVFLLVQDDFSGLLPITQSLFPNTDIQLCTVHMQRNAKTHLSKTDAAEFQQRWRAIKSSWNLEVANQQFELLCDRFAKTDSTFIGELRKKRQHYLAFLHCPEPIRRSLSTTNVVEAINGQLEIMRRNSGGYFQSDETLKLKLGITVTSLENVRWSKVTGKVEECLHQLNAMFQKRFESEE